MKSDKIVISVRDLKKFYQTKNEEKHAIDGISFEVKEGEVFGLLGQNGAGKTTTIKILTTLLLPSDGIANVLGFDVVRENKEIRKHINFVFGGEKGVYGKLTAIEYLQYFCTLYKIAKSEQKRIIQDVLERVELQEAAYNQPINTYSKGMVQRLHIARCLINSPKIIFLDEPTIGLDPLGAKLLRKLIIDLSNKGISIILTTHYMQEADDLCDRIAFMKDGKISMIGTSEHIKNSCSHLHLYEALLHSDVDLDTLNKMEHFSNVTIESVKKDFCTLRFETTEQLTNEDIEEKLNQYGNVIKLEKRELSLEDAYIFHMGG